MSPDKILDYLRYLRGRVDVLQNSPVVGLHDISPLQAELRLFRERANDANVLTTEMRDRLCAIDLHITPDHLAQSRQHMWATWWLHLPYLRLLRLMRQERDKAVIDAELSKLRDALFDLYCLVEASSKRI
jgi:hypothetical protein